MTEVVCLRCNAQSPETALYCQQCGQPLRCKECRAVLLPNAHACIQCGKLILERTADEQFNVGIGTVPPGYNRLKLHETPEVRDLDLIVSNEAIEHIGDFLPSLIGNRPKGNHNNPVVDDRAQQQAGMVEVTPGIPSPQPQLPAASSPPTLSKNSSEGLIWEIFRKQDGGILKLDIKGLKASSKRDYTTRLVYLYLYAKFLLDEDNVSRTEIYAFLDNVGLKDNNVSTYIAQAHGVSSEDGTLRLTFEGRKKAEQLIADIFNPDLEDSWPPNADTRSTGTRIKKSSKKSSEHQSAVDANVAGMVSHPLSKELAETIEHATIVTLSLVDKALLALYGIYRTGKEQEVPLASIIKYLYDAFEVPVQSNALSSALYKAREEKTAKASYMNFRDGHGYKITQSGRKYIEDSLKLKKPQMATSNVNVELNGANQQ